MNEDELIRQLREADEDAGPAPALPPDLARRVLRRSVRRRLQRRVAAAATAAAAVLLAAGAWYSFLPPNVTAPRFRKAGPTRTRLPASGRACGY